MQNNRKQIVIVSTLLFLIALGVNQAMPLFATFSANENLGSGMVGLATASYIFGLLPVALFLGGISERFGRKRILLFAVFLAILSVSTITIFPNLYALIFARIIIGAAVGIGISTGSALITVLFNQSDEKNAASLVAFATTIGFGGGALLTGIFISFHFTVRPPTFWIVLFGLVIGLVLGGAILPNDAPFSKAIKIVRLPLFPKGVARFNLSIAMFWSATAIIIAILPTQLALFNFGNWSGFSLFLVNGTGLVFLPFARKLTVDNALSISYILLPIGLAILSFGSLGGSLPWIFLGCSTLGCVSYGFGYYATLNGVGQLDPLRKAQVVAGYLISAYVGFGGTALVIGFLAEQFGLSSVLSIYLLLTGALSITLLLLQFRPKGKVWHWRRAGRL